MYNLEHIKFSEVVDIDGVKYSDFRKKLKPNYFVVWRDIIFGYILMLGTLGFLSFIEISTDYQIVTMLFISILFAFLTAFWLSFIQLFIHEAAHYNIHPNKNRNDFLATIFIGIILGINTKGYRKTHWKHHQKLGYSDDTENSYFNALSIFNIIKMITGIHAILILLNRNKLENAQSKESIKEQKKSLLVGGLLNLLFLGILFFNEFYFTCTTWILTVVVFYPFFAAMRQTLEHRDEKFTGKNLSFFNANHGAVSRIFKPRPLSFFFGGAGFNRHLIHHWDPQISYTNLKEVEEYLCKTDSCAKIIEESKTTYLRTFFKLLEI